MPMLFIKKSIIFFIFIYYNKMSTILYDQYLIIKCTQNTQSEFIRNLILGCEQLSYINYYQNNPINIDILEELPYSHINTALANLSDPIAEYAAMFFINVGIHDRFTHKKIIPKIPIDVINKTFKNPEIIKTLTTDYLDNQDLNNGFYITTLTHGNLLTKIKKAKNILPNASLIIGDSIENEIYDINHKKIGKYIKKALEYFQICIANNEYPNVSDSLKIINNLFTTGDIKYYEEYLKNVNITDKNGLYVLLGFNEIYRDVLGYKPSFTCLIMMVNMDNQFNKAIQVIRQKFDKYEYDLLQKNYNKCTRTDIACDLLYAGGDNFGVIPVGFKMKIPSEKCSVLHLIFPDLITQATTQDPPKKQFFHDNEYKNIVNNAGIDAVYFTLLHEFGHSSGNNSTENKLEKYFNYVEESRADLFSLYNIYNFPYMKSVIYNYLTNGFFIQPIRTDESGELDGAHFVGRYYVASSIIRDGQKEKILDILGDDLETPNTVEIKIHDFDRLREIIKKYFLHLQEIKDTNNISEAKKIFESGKNTIKSWTEKSKDILNKKPYPVFVFN